MPKHSCFFAFAFHFSKRQWIVLAGILNFSLWSPLWNNENKSCLNDIKFWEVSQNLKTSRFWKLQLSMSCGTQKSAKIPLPGAKMIWSFHNRNVVIIERFTDSNWWILPVATWVWNSVKVIFTWTSRWSFFSGNAKKRFRITLFTLKNEKKICNIILAKF